MNLYGIDLSGLSERWQYHAKRMENVSPYTIVNILMHIDIWNKAKEKDSERGKQIAFSGVMREVDTLINVCLYSPEDAHELVGLLGFNNNTPITS